MGQDQDQGQVKSGYKQDRDEGEIGSEPKSRPRWDQSQSQDQDGIRAKVKTKMGSEPKSRPRWDQD